MQTILLNQPVLTYKENKWFSLMILLTAPLLSVIDVFIINVAIPSIKAGVKATDAEVQFMIAGYLLSYSSFQITSGRAGDYLGRKKVFFWGMFFFTLTLCLCGLSNTALQLNIARFFQGVSAAMMLPQTIAMIQVIFPGHKERTRAVGFYGITLGVASILGQFLGGYLSSTHFVIAGWRLIFFINLPVGLVALWATAKYLKETPKNGAGKFDYSGVAILTLALVSLIFPLIQGREQGWPLWSLMMLFTSFFIFYYFIRNQQKKLRLQQTPLINTDLFKIRDFNIGLLCVLFYFMMHTSYLLVCTIYLQNGLGIGAYQSGLFFVVFGTCFTISSFLSIRYVVKFGKKVLQFGTLLIIIAFLLQAKFFKPGFEYSVIYSIMALYGLGSGLVLPSLMNVALKSIPQHFAGAASGVYTTAQQASSALGISIIGGIFYYILNRPGITTDYSKAFHSGLSAEIVCLVAVSYLLYILPEKNSSLLS